MTAFAIRYFIALQLQPVYVQAGFGLLVSLGCVQLYLSPDDPTAPLATLLLWQMFAVSTGFRAAARAGHYDRLLTSGVGRRGLAAVHCLLAVAPGAVAWLILAAFSAIVTTTVLPLPLEVASLLAWCLVSTVGWSAGLWLPRLSAGVAWVTAILLFGTTHAGFVQMRLLMNETALRSYQEQLMAAFTVVVCPFLLLGSPPGAEYVSVRVIAALISLLALAIGMAMIDQAEFPLSAR
jgi:hypothetical protein